MAHVGLKDLSIALTGGLQHSRFFEAVQLQPDGIGALIKLCGHGPEIGPALRVEEELQQEFDAGFGCN